MMTWIKKVFFSDKKIKRLFWTAIVFAIMISGWRALTLYSRDMSVFVRVSMKSIEAGTAALYYDVGQGLNSKNVSISSVYGDGTFHDVKLEIPFNKALFHLRFDPPSISEGEIVINKVDIVDRYGRILYDFNLNRLKPANQIRTFDFINGNIHFSIDEKANDPQINILVDRPISFKRLQLLSLMWVVPEFIILFLICVLLIYVWSRWTDPARRRIDKRVTWINQVFFSDKKIKRLFWAAFVFIILISGWNALILSTREMSVFVRISMKSPESGQAALYYDVGRQFNSRHVSTARVYGDGQFHAVKFKLPFLKKYYNLRFDPPSLTSGEIVIDKVDIVDRDGRTLHRFKLDRLKPVRQISTFVLSDGKIRFSMAERANDPQIGILMDQMIDFDRLQLLAGLLAKQAVPEFLISFLVFLLIFASLMYVWSRWKDPVIATLVVLAIVITGWQFYDDFTSVYFRLSMQSAVTGQDAAAELFYDQGYGLSGGDFAIARTRAGDQFHDYTFKIPRNVYFLRLDPMMMTAGTILIKKMEITDRSGNVLKAFPLHQAGPEVGAENQIKTFEFRDEWLKVVTEDKAYDPQISIMLDATSIKRIHTRTFPPARTVLANLFWPIALLAASIVVWKRYREGILRTIESPFFLEKLPLLYLGCALGVILAMAFISGLDVHPDELGHANSVGYYSDAWLPPSVDDPKVLKTISGYGVSQLFRLEMVYFLAGKFTALLSKLVHDDYLRLRLFNGMLFLILLLIVSRRIQHVPLLVWGLVLTPQVWYIFSYFNADGFAFFIAFLLAWQLVDPDSLTRRYLGSTTLWGMWPGGILCGALVGALLLSKMNYYLYMVFILVMIAWDFVSDRWDAQGKENRFRLKKWALVACVVLCVYLPPMLYDQYVNDFNKDEKISKFAEKNAAYPFKANTIMTAPDDSYPGLYLRSKGTLWYEIFLENNYWRTLTLYSFFGVYGYMNIYADSPYYETLYLFLLGMVLLIYFYAAGTMDFKQGVAFWMTLLFLLLAIGQSTYASWTGDFQPQGRYLFPMIPIAMVGLSRLNPAFQKRIIPGFNLILFIFSMTSFVFYALLFIPKIG